MTETTRAETIREKLRQYPGVGLGVGAFLVIVAALIVWSLLRTPTVAPPAMAARLYFTDDDGKTFFTDDSARIAPFAHDGKTAYQAAVFRCGNKPLFVGYLIAYDPATKAALEAMSESDRRAATPAVLELRVNRSMVRRPGDKKWLRRDGDAPLGAIVDPPCPDGSGDHPVEVLP